MQKGLMFLLPTREFYRRLAAIVLVCVLPGTLLAQESSPLKLLVISGTGAVNDLRTNTTVPTVVELRDDRDQPVLRGAVTFILPEAGPGGRFADGSRSLFVLTDRRGRATLTGFIPNQVEGPFQIAVEATASGNSVRALVRQYNNSFPAYSAPRTANPTAATARRGSGTGSKILLTLFLGVAVAAGSIVALKNGGNGKIPPTTTVSIGGVTVGGPR
jgi:hypothetical protein